MSTLLQLKQDAETVRDEKGVGKNTATRLGTLFVNIVDWLSVFNDAVTTIPNHITIEESFDCIEYNVVTENDVTLFSFRVPYAFRDEENFSGGMLNDYDYRKFVELINSIATESQKGLMSPEDKKSVNKIDTIVEDVSGLKTSSRSLESAVMRLGINTFRQNANDVKVTSRYLCETGTTNVPSTPCYLETMAADSTFILQRATMKDGSEKRRVFTNNKWGQWL